MVRSGAGTAGARRDLTAIAGAGVFAYYVLVGSLASRESMLAPLIHIGLAAVLVTAYVSGAARRADRLDRALLIALLLFAAAGILSMFPRQSLDSVLACLVYVSAAFIAREILARESGRRIFLLTAMVLSAAITLMTALQWDLLYIRWWSLTDWSTAPPLGMNLPSAPWGHRHDLALLIAMLYPAWWVGRITWVRAVVAVVIGLLGLSAIITGGSRMVWLAMAGATLVVVAPVILKRARWELRHVIIAGVAAAAVLVAIVASGVAASLAERVLGGASLAERTAMWGPLIGAWTDRPFAGLGPGSFPWILQLTDYFNTHSFSPRHPDSALIQVLAEAGVLGLLAMGVVVVSVGQRLLRSRSAAATWALVAFGIAALAGNPTDFPFMVGVAIAWLGFAAPHEREAASSSPRTSRLMRHASLVALGVIGIAMSATMIASMFYADARDRVARHDLPGAAESLRTAQHFDPGLAIYPRQLGTVELVTGNVDAAIADLGRSIQLNSADDLAWRILSLARLEGGDLDLAHGAVNQAVALQRGDVTNLLVLSMIQEAEHEGGAAYTTLAEVVQAWPEVVAAPEWSAAIGSLATSTILDAAGLRWMADQPSPEPLHEQPLTIHAMTGREFGMGEDGSRLSPTLTMAFRAVMACDATATQAMEDATSADRREATYWALASRQAALTGGDQQVPIQLFWIMTGDPLLADGDLGALNPLDENGVRGTSADRWGYRRPPIDWPASPWDLPSPRSGYVNLFMYPAQAARTINLEPMLSRCP